MKKIIICILVTMLLFPLGAACKKKVEESPVEINPTEGAPNLVERDVLLYFGMSKEGMLVGEERTIYTPVNLRVEEAILTALIAGPANNNRDFKGLINPHTKIVQMTESGDTFIVTLSNEFLNWNFLLQNDSSEEDTQLKMLAVKSIVNTIIEASGYARVQILVDRDDSKTGQRIQLEELGMGEKSGVLEPQERDDALLWTAGNAAKKIVSFLQNKEYASLYEMTAKYDETGAEKMQEAAFIGMLQNEANITLDSFFVEGEAESVKDNQVYLLCTYTHIGEDGEPKRIENIPLCMRKDNGIWKMSETAIKKLIGQ